MKQMAVEKNMDAIDLAKRIEKAVNAHLDELKKEHDPSTATNPNAPKASNPIIVTPKIGSIL